MTDLQQFFLSLLADHVHGRVTAGIPEFCDWDTLYGYAKDQSLTGVLYLQLKQLKKAGKAVSEDALDLFHKGFFSEVYYAENRYAFLQEVRESFTEKGINYLPFKGEIMKEYWPVPSLRTMGDIDLLIHTEDRKISDEAMQMLGYQKFVDNHAVWTYYQKDIMFELHDHMFYEYLANQIDYRTYFDHAWESMTGPKWKEFHLLYLLTHMAKHIINSGIGLRAYLDLVFLCQKQGEQLDWEWIQNELEKLKLQEFTRICFAFCRRWFSVEMPLSPFLLEEAFAEQVTEKLFRDGTFGLFNHENAGAHVAKEVKRSDQAYGITSARLILKKLFPPYEDLQLIPWYSFVDGRPWFLPAAWVYRWFYCLFHKGKYSGELLTEPVRLKTSIQKREELLKQWGL